MCFLRIFSWAVRAEKLDFKKKFFKNNNHQPKICFLIIFSWAARAENFEFYKKNVKNVNHQPKHLIFYFLGQLINDLKPYILSFVFKRSL